MLKKLFYRPSSTTHQFMLVGAVGGFGFVIDLGILFALITFLTMEPILANTISTVIVVFINWFINRKLVFGGGDKVGTEIAQFFVSSLAGLAVANTAIWLIYYVVEWQTPMGLILGKFLGLFMGIAIKFFLYKHWVFKKK